MMIDNKFKSRYASISINIFLIFFFVSLFSSLVSGSIEKTIDPQWIYSSDSASAEITVSSVLEIKKERDSKIESIVVNNNFFPRSDHNLEILNKNYFPIIPEESFDKLSYVFNNPKFDSESIGYKYLLKLKSEFIEVNHKFTLPLDYSKIPFDYRPYVSSAKIIDSNDMDILALSDELSQGIDDLYVLSFVFADWVHDNIVYTLDPTTSDLSQSASWTLKNKKGVCDEFTSLFIALLRAKGIPARYVSGIAYTNSDLFSDEWGFHGWAQVYFPGYGWIDFDPTYGQYGFVDLSHIPLKYSIDSGESSMSYSMKSINTQLVNYPMTEDILLSDIKKSDSSFEDDVSVTLNLNSDSYSFGSYVFLMAHIENNNNFYVPYSIFVGKTYSLETIGDSEKNIILLPNEKKEIYFVFKISESDGVNLQEKMDYVFPLIIYTSRNNSFETEFKVGKRYDYFSSLEIDNLIQSLFPELDNIKSDSNLIFSCSQENEYYVYENVSIECLIKNLATEIKRDVKICLFSSDNYCEDNIIVNSNSVKKINISFPGELVDYTGFIRSSLYVDDSLFSTSIFSSKILPELNVSFKNIKYPDKVRFGEGFEILIDLSSNSPEEIKGNILMDYELFRENFTFDISTPERKFSIQLNSGVFIHENNSINLIMMYSDVNGKEYLVSEQINIDLYDLTFFERVELFFNNLSYKISNFFKR